MNFRFTAILLAVIAVALLGMLAYLFLSPDKATPDLALDGLAGIKPEDIDTVEIKRTQPKNETLVFTREKDGPWTVREPQAARLDQTFVNDLVRDLLAAKPTTHPDLTDDPKPLGLDKPTIEVTLRKGSDHSATLRLGNTTIGGSRAVTFVTTGTEPNRPFAVPTTSLAAIFKDGDKVEGEAWKYARDLVDFRARGLFSVGGTMLTDAKALKLKQGKATLALEKDKTGTWVFTEPTGFGDADLGGDPVANSAVFSGVRPLLVFLGGLQVTGPADFLESVSKEDEKKYGLDPDDPTVVRIDYTPANGATEILYVGKKVDEKAVPTVYYAKRLGDSAVVKVRTDRIDALAKTIADPGILRNRDLLSDTERENIDAIDLDVGGGATSLRKVNRARQKVWVLLGGSGEPAETNHQAVEDLIMALAKPRVIVDFPPPPFDALFNPDEWKGRVSVWVNGLDGEAKPDAKPKGTPIILTFGRRGEDQLFVRKSKGERVTVGRVAMTLLPFATKTRLDFLDPKVLRFLFAGTNTIMQPAAYTAKEKRTETVELVKDETPNPEFPLGKWTWVKPEGMKGKVADALKVQALMAVVATLSPGKIVAENPSEAELKKFGFDPKTGPRMKVTVTPKAEKDTKDLVYEFGAETEDKAYVYARHGGGTVVYMMPRVMFDRFQTEDLSPKPAETKKE